MYRLFLNEWCPIQFSSVRSVVDKIAEWYNTSPDNIDLVYNPAGDGQLDVHIMPKISGHDFRNGYILLPSGRHF